MAKKKPKGYNRQNTGNGIYDWEVTRQKYICGDDTVTYRVLAQELGCAEATVHRRAAKEDWTNLRAEYRERVAIKAMRKASTYEAQLRAEMIQVGRGFLSKSIKALPHLDPATMSHKEIRCYMKDAIEVMCKAAGIAQEHNIRVTKEDIDNMSIEEMRKRLDELGGK